MKIVIITIRNSLYHSFFACPRVPEPQGLFSWEIAIETWPRHNPKVRTSETICSTLKAHVGNQT